ncbi:MAG: hypothetical protein V1743_01975 [Nanoarchaeota archaeon]
MDSSRALRFLTMPRSPRHTNDFSIFSRCILLAVLVLLAGCRQVSDDKKNLQLQQYPEPPGEEEGLPYSDAERMLNESTIEPEGILMPAPGYEHFSNYSFTTSPGAHAKVVNLAGSLVSRYKNYILVNIEYAFFNTGDSLTINYDFSKTAYVLFFEIKSTQDSKIMVGFDTDAYIIPLAASGEWQAVKISLGNVAGKHALRFVYDTPSGFVNESRVENANCHIRNIRLAMS